MNKNYLVFSAILFLGFLLTISGEDVYRLRKSQQWNLDFEDSQAQNQQLSSLQLKALLPDVWLEDVMKEQSQKEKKKSPLQMFLQLQTNKKHQHKIDQKASKFNQELQREQIKSKKSQKQHNKKITQFIDPQEAEAASVANYDQLSSYYESQELFDQKNKMNNDDSDRFNQISKKVEDHQQHIQKVMNGFVDDIQDGGMTNEQKVVDITTQFDIDQHPGIESKADQIIDRIQKQYQKNVPQMNEIQGKTKAETNLISENEATPQRSPDLGDDPINDNNLVQSPKTDIIDEIVEKTNIAQKDMNPDQIQQLDDAIEILKNDNQNDSEQQQQQLESPDKQSISAADYENDPDVVQQVNQIQSIASTDNEEQRIEEIPLISEDSASEIEEDNNEYVPEISEENLDNSDSNTIIDIPPQQNENSIDQELDQIEDENQKDLNQSLQGDNSSENQQVDDPSQSTTILEGDEDLDNQDEQVNFSVESNNQINTQVSGDDLQVQQESTIDENNEISLGNNFMAESEDDDIFDKAYRTPIDAATDDSNKSPIEQKKNQIQRKAEQTQSKIRDDKDKLNESTDSNDEKSDSDASADKKNDDDKNKNTNQQATSEKQNTNDQDQKQASVQNNKNNNKSVVSSFQGDEDIESENYSQNPLSSPDASQDNGPQVVENTDEIKHERRDVRQMMGNNIVSDFDVIDQDIDVSETNDENNENSIQQVPEEEQLLYEDDTQEEKFQTLEPEKDQSQSTEQKQANQQTNIERSDNDIQPRIEENVLLAKKPETMDDIEKQAKQLQKNSGNFQKIEKIANNIAKGSEIISKENSKEGDAVTQGNSFIQRDQEELFTLKQETPLKQSKEVPNNQQASSTSNQGNSTPNSDPIENTTTTQVTEVPLQIEFIGFNGNNFIQVSQPEEVKFEQVPPEMKGFLAKKQITNYQISYNEQSELLEGDSDYYEVMEFD